MTGQPQPNDDELEAARAEAQEEAYGEALCEARIEARAIAHDEAQAIALSEPPEGDDAAEQTKTCEAHYIEAFATHYVTAFNEAFDKELAGLFAKIEEEFSGELTAAIQPFVPPLGRSSGRSFFLCSHPKPAMLSSCPCRAIGLRAALTERPMTPTLAPPFSWRGIVQTITLRQPWAALWIAGRKTFETRSRPIRHRGLLRVHAALKFVVDLPLELEAICADEFGPDWSVELPRGALIGTVNLVDCVPTETLNVTAEEAAQGDFTAGRWAWRDVTVEVFAHPVPWRGSQCFFRTPAAIVAPAT